MNIKEIVMEKRFLVTGGSGLFILFLLVFFPETSGLSVATQSVIALTFFFFLFPVLYCKMVLKEPVSSIGLRSPANISGWVSLIGSVVVAYGVFLFLRSTFPSFALADSLPFEVERSFWSLVRYELFVMATLFLYEVFFRGFSMLLWLRSFGRLSILLQVGIFLGFLFASGSFGWEQGRMILFAPFAGYIAFSSRSIWYSWIGSVFFLLIADITLLVLSK